MARFMDAKGIIFDIKRFAINDGPGLRTTIFFKGCPLACSWCHNPESRDSRPALLFRPSRCIRCLACVEACPNRAVAAPEGVPVTDYSACRADGGCVEACPAGAREIVGREYSVEAIMEEIRKDRVFYDESGGGVTFSGGEPLSQPGFLSSLLRACRREGIHTAVDTCGFAEPGLFLETAALADLVLFDLKAMNPATHLQLTGVYNMEILRNLSLLSGSDTEVLIRIPLVPGANDDEENLRATGIFVSGLAGSPGVELLPFHPMTREKHRRFSLPYRGPSEQEYPGERIERAGEILEGFGVRVILPAADRDDREKEDRNGKDNANE